MYPLQDIVKLSLGHLPLLFTAGIIGPEVHAIRWHIILEVRVTRIYQTRFHDPTILVGFLLTPVQRSPTAIPRHYSLGKQYESHRQNGFDCESQREMTSFCGTLCPSLAADQTIRVS